MMDDGRTIDHRCGGHFKLVFACGSMVGLFSVFRALRARKTENDKMKSTAVPELVEGLPKAIAAFDTRPRNSCHLGVIHFIFRPAGAKNEMNDSRSFRSMT
jgi:hypothetical protein